MNIPLNVAIIAVTVTTLALVVVYLHNLWNNK